MGKIKWTVLAGCVLTFLMISSCIFGLGELEKYEFGDTHVTDGELIIFFEGGKATENVYYLGEPWCSENGYLEGTGKFNDIFSTQIIAGGDFHVKATISIPVNVNEQGEGSGATFAMDMNNNRIGFASISHPWKLFVGANANGEIFPTGDTQLDMNLEEFGFEDVKHIERPFLWEVVRNSDRITFYIDGQKVHQVDFPNEKAIGKIGFHPWRGTMRIYDWAFLGQVL